MNVWHGWDQGVVRGGLVSIGNFDGVHRGHQRMLSTLRERGADLGVPTLAVTFDPHPTELLRPGQAPQQLTTLGTRLERIARVGVSDTLVLRPEPTLLQMSPREFFDEVLCRVLDTRGVVEGENFRFGRGRAGGVAELAEWCQAAGLECHVVPPVLSDGWQVSSSAIRQSIAAGEVTRAAELLGQPHQAEGFVEHGAARGRLLGFPTLNLGQVKTLLPAEGVYAGRARTTAGAYPAAINLGPNPTFGEATRKFEAHLLDFQGDLYDQPVTIEFLTRLRATRPFAGKDELIAQLQQDITDTRSAVAGWRANP
ncbi:MAG: bifunctional riboflavin kinase/FAD synthetase [Planctomycetaceae bacterium]|jgi:riboflavin kinase/FMN adenylyltransferase